MPNLNREFKTPEGWIEIIIPDDLTTKGVVLRHGNRVFVVTEFGIDKKFISFIGEDPLYWEPKHDNDYPLPRHIRRP